VHESIVLSFFRRACIARTIAIRLHDYCAIYDAPPTSPLYAINHTILVIAISCKGQILDSRAGRGIPKMLVERLIETRQGNGAGNDRFGCLRRSASNKNSPEDNTGGGRTNTSVTKTAAGARRQPVRNIKEVYEQALICLSDREIVDASRGRTFHCKMANDRLFTCFCSNGVGLIYLAI